MRALSNNRSKAPEGWRTPKASPLRGSAEPRAGVLECGSALALFDKSDVQRAFASRAFSLLPLVILQTLTVQPMHGYAIAQHIERLSGDVLAVEQGSLYPALERLQKKGWLTSKWGPSPTGRRARYYTLTAAGRRQLGAEITSFDRVLAAIQRVLQRA